MHILHVGIALFPDITAVVTCWTFFHLFVFVFFFSRKVAEHSAYDIFHRICGFFKMLTSCCLVDANVLISFLTQYGVH